MEEIILFTYIASLSILFVFGSHGFIMIYYYLKYRRKKAAAVEALSSYPVVTVQLPVFNELYVVGRLIDAACAMIYPKEKLEIQVLDDSTDGTVDVVAQYVDRYRKLGFDIKQVHRTNRQGFKAGALKEGLTDARGEFVAIFDADFVPRPDFLLKTIPHFGSDPRIGMVQTRWEHINADYSLLTRTQAMALDGHFVIEQAVRNKVGLLHQLQRNGRRLAEGMYLRCRELAGRYAHGRSGSQLPRPAARMEVQVSEQRDLAGRTAVGNQCSEIAAIPVDKRRN